jgi:hypothetical protein
MGASSSRAAPRQEHRSRCCRCFEQPARQDSYAHVDNSEREAARRRGSESPTHRRRRRRHRSTSASSAESIEEELDRRGRTRERRGSAPRWEIVLEILRPDGGYTRLQPLILSTVRRRTLVCHTHPSRAASARARACLLLRDAPSASHARCAGEWEAHDRPLLPLRYHHRCALPRYLAQALLPLRERERRGRRDPRGVSPARRLLPRLRPRR